MKKKMRQFELWKDCDNHCTYCYLKHFERNSTKQFKLDSIQYVVDWLGDDKNFEEYSGVGFIGGEFFQGQLNDTDLKLAWTHMIWTVKERIKNGDIDEVWINATLISPIQVDLFDTLKQLEEVNGQARVWVVTSFDSVGRFHTDKALGDWHHTMEYLTAVYPWVLKNTCMIITEDLCQRVIDKRIDFSLFCEQYHTTLFLKPPYGVNKVVDGEVVTYRIDGLHPTRKQFLEFLTIVADKWPTLYPRMIDVSNRADTLDRLDVGQGETKYENRDKMNDDEGAEIINPKCGHPQAYAFYSDSDKCGYCDKLVVEETVDV